MKGYKLSLLWLLVGIMLTGCGRVSDEIQVVQIWEKESDVEEEPIAVSEDIEGAKSKIGMVTDLGGVEDESFNQGAWEGLESLSKITGVKVTYIETEKVEQLSDNFQTLVEDDCNLIWGIGYSCADAMLERAAENPDVNFAVIDNAYEETPANVTGVTFRAQEPSFLVGFIAGSVSRTGKVGFIGGVQGEVVDSFRYGFAAGASYAGSTYGKEIKVEVEYADSFTDPDKGMELAKKMYENGCDVIFHAAGGTGMGVIEAAKETDHYVIGVDRDQSYLAPNQVLTSALKMVNVAIERVSESYLRGEDIGGKTYSLGMTEGAVGIPTQHDNYKDEIYDATLLIEDKIKSGLIIPPATEKEYELFIKGL